MDCNERNQGNGEAFLDQSKLLLTAREKETREKKKSTSVGASTVIADGMRCATATAGAGAAAGESRNMGVGGGVLNDGAFELLPGCELLVSLPTDEAMLFALAKEEH